jgi:hypothetical protein
VKGRGVGGERGEGLGEEREGGWRGMRWVGGKEGNERKEVKKNGGGRNG